MIITEAELREAWDNGRGSLPDFPPGTRFTPSAKDFLAAHGPQAGAPHAPSAASPAPAPPCAAAADPARRELTSPTGMRLILTATDVDDLVAAGPITLVVHPNVTVTDAARERLGKAGIRILPWVEPRTAVPLPAAPLQALPASAQASPAPAPADLAPRIKSAVMARLGGSVDEAVVDAVIRRVLASL